jgi:diguanylate cyclase (GGDEF)-like protein/PAS domain S-box-containing protein
MGRKSTAQWPRAAGRAKPGPRATRRRAPALPALEALVAAYPGPAARLDSNLHVIAANPSAQPLLIDLLAEDSRLARLVAQVAEGGAGRLEAIVLPTAPVATTMEVAAIPVRDEIVLLGRDTSFNANLRDALTDSRRRYKDLVEISSDFVWETDASGRFAFVSPGGALGWRAEELNGRAASEFMIEDEAEANASPFSGRRRLDNVSVWLRRADGQAACVSLSSVPLHGPDGAWLGARGVCRDVTEASLRDTALAEARTREQLFTYIVRTIRDEVEPAAMLSAAASAAARATSAAGTIIWRYSADGGFVIVSEFGAKLPEELAPDRVLLPRLATDNAVLATETPPVEIVTGSGQLIGAVTRFRQKVNGAIALWRRNGWSAADRGLLSELADQLGIAQAQIANIEALTALARTDPLTGLLNRRTFLEYVAPRVARVHRSGQPGALVYLDLDNFKLVNDRFGHGRGDEALKHLAQALLKESRMTDLVARLGGDEFVVWLDDTDRKGATDKAKRLLALDKVLAPFSGDPARKLSISIGVVMCEAGGAASAEELIACADTAMYRAKKSGKNGIVFAEAGSAGGAA